MACYCFPGVSRLLRRCFPALLAALIWSWSAASRAEVPSSTAYGNSQYVTHITNRTGEVVNNVKLCTPFENTSDVGSANFLPNWSVKQYLDDWDRDGIEEVCFDFTSAGNLDDLGDTGYGDIYITTTSTMSPLAMKDANGPVQAWGRVNGDLIREDFFPESFNPYADLSVESRHGEVSGGPVHCRDNEGICRAGLYWGTSVALLATPFANYEFSGWQGCPSASGNICTVVSNGPVLVTALFVPILHPLLVSITEGTGRVVSEPPGIDCEPGTPSSHEFQQGSVVTLSAAPGPGEHLTGFTGCDRIDGLTCEVEMSQARQVSAEFSRSFNWPIFLPAIRSSGKAGE